MSYGYQATTQWLKCSNSLVIKEIKIQTMKFLIKPTSKVFFSDNIQSFCLRWKEYA
jgi:hypothetical protein